MRYYDRDKKLNRHLIILILAVGLFLCSSVYALTNDPVQQAGLQTPGKTRRWPHDALRPCRFNGDSVPLPAPDTHGGLFRTAGMIGFLMNMVTAVFELLPIPPCEGKEIFAWNKFVWVAAFIPLFALYLFMTM